MLNEVTHATSAHRLDHLPRLCGPWRDPRSNDVPLSAEGRVVVEAGKALMNRRFRVEPTAATCGKIWKLAITPKEDVSFCLFVDVVPFVSDHPGRVLTTQ